MKKSLLLLLLPLVLTGCNGASLPDTSYQDGYDEGYQQGHLAGVEEGYMNGENKGYEDGYYKNEQVFSIHTELQSRYLNDIYTATPYGVDGKSENSLPNSITLAAPKSNLYSSSEVTKYVLKVSKDKNFTEVKEYTKNNCSGIFSLINLNINTRYFYKFVAYTSDKSYESEVKTFFVEDDALRNLYVDGVTNFRDLGGWSIGDNKYTPQNMIYRCARLHDNTSVNITEKGKATIRELGIKTEIDLRSASVDGLTDFESKVEGVSYFNCPMQDSTYFTDKNTQESLKNTFRIMSDKTNYPLLFHCAIGTDRTGFVAFCLNALAGVDIEDLCRDYVFSSFANINGLRNYGAITSYRDKMMAYGSTLPEAIEGFMKSLGVTTGEVNALKAIVKGEEDTNHHHSADEWVVSDLNEEFHQKVCTDCDCGLVLEKEKHQFGDFIIDKEPTAAKDGQGHYVCSTCGYIKYVSIPHDYESFSFVGMKDYGDSTSFSFYLDTLDLKSISSDTELIVHCNDEEVKNVIVSYTPRTEFKSPYLTLTLPSAPNDGDVIRIKNGSVVSDGSSAYVNDKDIAFTYMNGGYYPSFYTGEFRSGKDSSDKIKIELGADFSDFLGGQASDGVQPYYTSTNKNKPSHFVYKLIRDGVVTEIINDNHDVDTIKTTTQMFWVAASILRISIAKTYLQDGDTFIITKGSVYADNAGHSEYPGVYRRYILEEDIVSTYNASEGKFVTSK